MTNPQAEEQNIISLLFKPKSWTSKQTKVGGMTFFKLSQFMRENWLYFGVLVVLVIIAYSNSLGNGLVSDDKLIEKEMPLFRSFGYMINHDLFSFFRKTFLYSFLYFLSGDNVNPVVFRLPNLLFHAGNTFLIFTILSLMNKKTVAFLAAVLFAVHPLNTEVVTWIAAGNYPQYVFFFLLSFLFYLLSSKSKKYYAFSIIFFTVALMTTNRLFLMPVFISYEFFLGDIRKNWRKLVPFVVLGFFWVGYSFFQINSVSADLAQQTYSSGGLTNLFLKIPYVTASYLELIFWPQTLTFYHSDLSFSFGILAWKFLLFILFSLAFIYAFFKNKFIAFWLSLFLIGLLLNLTPFKISQFIAERYAYFSMIGILVVVAYWLDKLIRSKKYRVVGLIVLSVITVSLAVRTIVRNGDWKDTDTLMLATVKTTPQSPRAQNNVGAYYFAHGDYQKAINAFEAAILANPRFADAYHNLAVIYSKQGEYDAAINLELKAISINKNLGEAYVSLLNSYLKKGDKESARKVYSVLKQAYPDNEILKKFENQLQ